VRPRAFLACNVYDSLEISLLFRTKRSYNLSTHFWLLPWQIFQGKHAYFYFDVFLRAWLEYRLSQARSGRSIYTKQPAVMVSRPFPLENLC
jgi:hypothetical protein